MPETQQVDFHHLTFVTERDGVTVGRPDTESYVVLPAEAAQLIQRLAAGAPVPEAAAWYQDTFGEQVDVEDFVETLRDLGFIRASGEPVAEMPPVRLRALGRAVFSPPAWLCYAAVTVAAAVLVIQHPRLRPGPHNVLFSPSLILIQVVVLLSQLVALYIHEGFHALAGRRLGLPSRFRVSFRLNLIVFETHLNGLLSVPRRKRYLPFFAGMLIDTVMSATLILLADADLHGDSLPWPGRLALAVAYTNALRMVFQLFLFLRTDPYYALTTALGCTNLAEASSAYLRDRMRVLLRKPGPPWKAAGGGAAEDDEADGPWTPRDEALAPSFAWFSVVGTAALGTFLGLSIFPVLVAFVRLLGTGLAHPGTAGLRFWDSTATVAIPVLQFLVLPPLIAYRNRRADRRRPGQPAPLSPISR